MELIEYTSAWVKGDVMQGKIMLIAGSVLLIVFVAILKSDNIFLSGTLIPMGLLLIILFGYGSFLTFTRNGHLEKVRIEIKSAPEQIHAAELAKAQNDSKNYAMLTPIWVVLIIVSAVLFFIFSATYYKGLAVGLMLLFLSALVVDGSLHFRLKPYLEVLQGPSEK